ncbi:MAG: hypothetical protein HXS44_07380 [Theionarchaea archaeon]|nr:hypothetical protein [Theionarchaea archaeon]
MSKKNFTFKRGDYTRGKISQKRVIQEYSRIAQQLCENPFIPQRCMAQNLSMSRNTVSKYLREMYAQKVMVGPWMSVNPHEDYKEYVYLMNFTDPFLAYDGLKEFPHVLYNSLTFGDWNTMVITDRHLDFSKLKGFELKVCWGVKGIVYTPPVIHATWDQSLKEIYMHLDKFNPLNREPENLKLDTFLNWGEKEWKLYHAFKYNVRRNVTPLLKRINVRYETYSAWIQTVNNHCTFHTEFYPKGYNTYVSLCLLLDSDYKQSVKVLFSIFPTTPIVVKVNNQLLVFLKVSTSEYRRDTICTMYDMKAVEMIRGIKKAQTVLEHQ